MSDHLSCLLKIKDPTIFTKPPQKITTRGLNDEKINDLNSKLLEINWDAMLVNCSLTEQHTKFQDTLLNIIDEGAPTIPSKYHITKPLKAHGSVLVYTNVTKNNNNCTKKYSSKLVLSMITLSTRHTEIN